MKMKTYEVRIRLNVVELSDAHYATGCATDSWRKKLSKAVEKAMQQATADSEEDDALLRRSMASEVA